MHFFRVFATTRQQRTAPPLTRHAMQASGGTRERPARPPGAGRRGGRIRARRHPRPGRAGRREHACARRVLGLSLPYLLMLAPACMVLSLGARPSHAGANAGASPGALHGWAKHSSDLARSAAAPRPTACPALHGAKQKPVTRRRPLAARRGSRARQDRGLVGLAHPVHGGGSDQPTPCDDRHIASPCG
jgi:hypothetical protein